MLQLLIEIGVWGGVVPTAISMAVLFLARTILPADLSERSAAALAFAAAFFAGYALLPKWAPLLHPANTWHWIPWICVIAGIVGPIGLARGVRTLERWSLYFAVAACMAALLVLTFPKLDTASRPLAILSFAAGLACVSGLLDGLPARVTGWQFSFILTGVAGVTAALLARFVSITLGQVAGVAAGALCGCAIAGMWRGNATMARGLILPYVIVVGGMAFVGYINAFLPAIPLLLVPAAPLALWICGFGPLARITGFWAVVVQVGVVAIPAGVAAVLLMMAEAAQQ